MNVKLRSKMSSKNHKLSQTSGYKAQLIIYKKD